MYIDVNYYSRILPADMYTSNIFILKGKMFVAVQPFSIQSHNTFFRFPLSKTSWTTYLLLIKIWLTPCDIFWGFPDTDTGEWSHNFYGLCPAYHPVSFVQCMPNDIAQKYTNWKITTGGGLFLPYEINHSTDFKT